MSDRRILNSWKEIASYLGRGVRTVQRWEALLGLPVHRPAGKDHSAVLAFSSELDQWLDARPMRQTATVEIPPVDAKIAELETLMLRAESVLERFEALLVRAEVVQQRLATTATLDALLVSSDQRNMARTAEAGAA